jgi:predicted porin
VHAGVSSNQSPVAADDQVFTRVDLATWSVGASGTIGKFKFAAGLNWQSGAADNIRLYNRLNGQPVTTPVDIRIAGFIYSIAYQF